MRAAALVALAALAFPGVAAAHTGVSAPVGSSFVARLTAVPAGVEAKVVDGDLQLWLRADPRLTVVVLGFSGEPYLRFSARGVEVNERSPAAYLNRSRPQVVPPGATPTAAPAWRTVSRGHVYRWHEDRLHALAVAARGGRAFVGTWIVPLQIDGRSARISGGLWHADRPSLLWFWPIVVTLLSVAALVRLRRRRLDGLLATALVLATLAASVVGRIGRDLYGRPDVTAGQLARLAVTCALAAGALALLRRRDWQTFVAILVGAGGVTAGLTLVGTLTHGFVLAALPAAVERAAAVVALAGGAATLLVAVAADGLVLPLGKTEGTGALRRPVPSSVGEAPS